MKRAISDMVKFFGDKMIREAEKGNNKYECPCFLLHEVEKPECLKKLDRERMAEK